VLSDGESESRFWSWESEAVSAGMKAVRIWLCYTQCMRCRLQGSIGRYTLNLLQWEMLPFCRIREHGFGFCCGRRIVRIRGQRRDVRSHQCESQHVIVIKQSATNLFCWSRISERQSGLLLPMLLRGSLGRAGPSLKGSRTEGWLDYDCGTMQCNGCMSVASQKKLFQNMYAALPIDFLDLACSFGWRKPARCSGGNNAASWQKWS